MLRLLNVEDEERDVLLILRALKKAGFDVTNKQVDTAEQMRDALSRQQWDIIISDYAMPRFNGRAALELLLETGLDIPFIVVSGTMGEETAVDMMKAGAHDYIMKNNMARLVPSIERELTQANVRWERKRASESLRLSEERYRTLFQSMDQGFGVVEMINDEKGKPVDYRFLETNPAFERQTGLPMPVIGRTVRELVPNHEHYWFENYGKVARTGVSIRFENYAFDPKRYYDVFAFRIGGDESRKVGILFTDITERRRNEIHRSTLLSLGEKLNRALSVNDAGKIISEAANTLFSWDACTIDLYDRGTDTIQSIITIDTIDGKHTDIQPSSQSVTPSSRIRRILSKGADIILRKESESFDSQAQPFGDKNRPSRSLLFAPMRNGDLAIGVISIQSYTLNLYTQDDLLLLQSLADYCSGAILRIQSYHVMQQSEERYRSLFEHMVEGYALCKMIFKNGRPHDFTFLETNNAFETLTGMKNVAGKKVSEVIPGIQQSDPEMFESYGRVSLSGVPERIELFVKAMEAWYSISIYSTQREYFVAVFDVVTDRKKAEEELRASERFARATIDALSSHIAILDGNGKILTVNKAWREFGQQNPPVSSDVYEGSNYLDVCDSAAGDGSEYGQDVAKGIRQVMTGAISDFVLEYPCHAPHEKRWFVVRVTRFYGEGPLRIAVAHENITERKLAENALQHSEQHYRELFDANPHPMWVYDLNTLRFLSVNDTAVEKYGYSREEFLSMTIRDIRPEDDLSRLEQNLDNPSSSIQHSGIWRHKLKSGQIIFVEVTSHAFNYGDTETRLVLANDITERLNVEQALRMSEERLRLSMRAGKQGWYDMNVQTGESIVNDEYALMLGFEPASFVETHRFWIERLHPDDRERAITAYDNYLNGRTNEFFIEFRQRANDGEWKWILSLGQIIEYDWYGKPLRMMGTHTDITSIKRAEESLIHSELMFRSVWDNTGSGMRLTDENGTVINVNDAYCRMVDKSRDEIIGQDLSIIFSEKDRARVIEKHRQNFRVKNVPSYHEKSLQLWNGKHVWFEVANSFINIQESRQLLLGIFTDITEKKKLESQFMRTQRLDSLGTLAGGIAHDLNNVLAPILLSIEILKRSFVDDNTRKILTAVESSARRGADIVKQILSFTRGLEAKMTVLQSRHLIDEMVMVFKETFPRSISIVNNTPKNLWTIYCDPTHFHQLILNLSVNARDAMPEGGTLTITAENKMIDEQYARMNIQAQPGRYVVYSISDTGTGMSPEIMDKIFDPFFTTKEFGKGTGLGLSTVHSIVKSHAGFMETKSEIGKGTTFTIFLPASQGTMEVLDEKDSIENVDGNGALILVVDDEQSVREVTKQTLEAFNYNILTASEGTEALAIYSAQPSSIVLVITDMMMPVMDGPKLVLALRKINPSVKIIGSSGLVDKRDRSGSEFGMNDFLLKPYTADDLLMCVQKVLKGK